MRKGDIEINKIVAWVLGLIVVLVLIWIMITLLNPSTEGSFTQRLVSLFNL